MRAGIHGWIAWIIIIALVASMLLWGVSSYLNQGANAQLGAADVNGQLISLQDVTNLYNRIRMQEPNMTTAKEQQTKKAILENLVMKQVMVTAAKTNGFSISKTQLEGIIAQDPIFQVDGQFSQERFQAVLSRMMMSPDQFMESIRASILMGQLQSGVGLTTFSLPENVVSALQLQQQQRDFRYSIIPANIFSNKINVSAQDVQEYYQKNIEQYQLPEKVKIQYVDLSLDNLMSKIKPTAAELKQFYQDNVSNYSIPASWQVAQITLHKDPKSPKAVEAKLQKVEQALKSGKSFASVAKEYSEDPFTAKTGGDMGWLTSASLSQAAFASALPSMKIGEISKPIATPTGYDIVKLENKKAQKVKPYSAVASTVKRAYVQQHAEKQFTDLNDQLANVTFENPDSLAPAAKQLGLKVQSTAWFTKSGLASGVSKNIAVQNAAFSDDVLSGNNSDVVNLNNKDSLVLRVLAHQAAKPQALASVSASIKQKLVKQMAAQKAQSLGEKAQQALTSDASYAKVAQQYGLVWKNASKIKRHNQSINSTVLAEAFALPRPQKTAVSVGGVALANGDYAVVMLNKIVNGSSKVSQQKQTLYKQQLQQTYAELQVGEVAKYYRRQAKIKYFKHNER
tara:strand:- start:222462 stop:224336 length:1875 start_codon:yes stop_codon:yes gene_type:complete